MYHVGNRGLVYRSYKPRTDRWMERRPKKSLFDTIWYWIEIISISFTATAVIVALWSIIF